MRAEEFMRQKRALHAGGGLAKLTNFHPLFWGGFLAVESERTWCELVYTQWLMPVFMYACIFKLYRTR